MKYFTIIVFCLIISCSTLSESVTYKNSKTKVKLRLEKGFDKQIIEQGQDLLYKFTYPDESVLYITDESGTPSINYKNIDNSPSGIQKSFISNIEGSTLTLQGVDENGKYWKNKKLKNISIGYLNTSEKHRKQFDDILLSVEADKYISLIHEATHSKKN